MEPWGAVNQSFDDPVEWQEALSVSIANHDWISLDRGTFTMEDAITQADSRTSLNPDGTTKVYFNLSDSLIELPATMDATHRAKAQDVLFYIRPNMRVRAWNHLAVNPVFTPHLSVRPLLLPPKVPLIARRPD